MRNLVLKVFCGFALGFPLVSSFQTNSLQNYGSNTALTSLTAKQQKKRASRNTVGNRTQSTSGFGGAAVTLCPCGSGVSYIKCCRVIHKDPKAFGLATPEQVVRARYSAYAKREIDFIIGSTHPLNKDFMTDIQHWREKIDTNCFDNFELTNCEILEETIESDNQAKVKFIARMTQVDIREKTAFMETSTFERAGKHIRNGAWLYKSGIVEAIPGQTIVDEVIDEANNKEEDMESD
jgi:SEC-C motif-containing protein